MFSTCLIRTCLIRVRPRAQSGCAPTYSWSAPTFMAHHGMRVSAALMHANTLLLAEGARRLKISKAAT